MRVAHLSGSTWRIAFDLATSLVMVICAVALVAMALQRRNGRQLLRPPADPISIEGDAIKGIPTAPLTLVMFADFECPYCARFAREVLPTIERTHVSSGRVRLVFHHMPLANHRHAIDAAISAECAGQQGRFWDMHDRLFSQGAVLDVSNLRRQAESLRLDSIQFNACLANNTIREKVVASGNAARGWGVTSTPSFLIGTALGGYRLKVSKAIQGALPLAEFSVALDEALNPRSIWTHLFMRFG